MFFFSQLSFGKHNCPINGANKFSLQSEDGFIQRNTIKATNHYLSTAVRATLECPRSATALGRPQWWIDNAPHCFGLLSEESSLHRLDKGKHKTPDATGSFGNRVHLEPDGVIAPAPTEPQHAHALFALPRKRGQRRSEKRRRSPQVPRERREGVCVYYNTVPIYRFASYKKTEERPHKTSLDVTADVFLYVKKRKNGLS